VIVDSVVVNLFLDFNSVFAVKIENLISCSMLE